MAIDQSPLSTHIMEQMEAIEQDPAVPDEAEIGGIVTIGIGLIASTGTVGIVAAVVVLGAMWIASEWIKAKEREGK